MWYLVVALLAFFFGKIHGDWSSLDKKPCPKCDYQVFPRDADGDIAPLRIIEGSNTGLGHAFGVVLTTDGELLVTDDTDDSIRVFSRLTATPAANGAGILEGRSVISFEIGPKSDDSCVVVLT